jgi:hypothetical protein
VRKIDQDYPLGHEERAVSTAATIETPVEQLDLRTVMRISQAVSDEKERSSRATLLLYARLADLIFVYGGRRR